MTAELNVETGPKRQVNFVVDSKPEARACAAGPWSDVLLDTRGHLSTIVVVGVHVRKVFARNFL